jgi:hypothetical protein
MLRDDPSPAGAVSRSVRAILAAPLLMLLAAGCGSRALETGYVPRPLNASDTERRAYYSGKYTKEAVRAEQEREAELRARRPGI